jgi:hypothetical protein
MEAKKSKLDEVEKYKERFIRWQNARIQQTGFLNNLFIALSSGILIWQGQSLSSGSIDLSYHISYGLSALLFFISIVIGCYIAWIRLADFRMTADVLRSLIESPPSLKDREEQATRKKMREEAKRYGENTIYYLPIQFLTFIFGFFLMAVDIIWNLF